MRFAHCLVSCAMLFPCGNVAAADEPDRSPVDLVLTSDETWLLTANQESSTVSLVNVATGSVVAEAPTSARPTALALACDDQTLLVTGADGGELVRYRLEPSQLVEEGRLFLGQEPRGVAISPDRQTAYVALAAGAAVAVVDLDSLQVLTKVPVGRWPRTLALSPDGSRLAVGCSGAGGISVVDTSTNMLAFEENFVGLNIGQLACSPDGGQVFFPWVAYGANPITRSNIQQGWVIADRIGRVRLDEKKRREAIALDPRGEAVADPYGMALTSDGTWMVTSASGSHELVVFKLPGLGWHDFGGPGDHIDQMLLMDDERFYRIAVDGRPLVLRMAKDDRHVYVANALLNAVQVVDLKERTITRTIALGGPDEPSLARRGEAIFFDAERSLDQWYSCHTCHWEGGTNAVTMDTTNDGSRFTYKTVLSLRHATETGPWTWHGWQKDFSAAMHKSLTETMEGSEPTADDVEALVAYLATLDERPNPNRLQDGTLTEEARRGEGIFQGEKAACIQCHNGPRFTDGEIHDVGTNMLSDRYQGYNTPSLLEVHERILLLHDGRAKSLEKLLTGVHSPDKVAGTEALTADELSDLIAYLMSL